MNRSVREEKQTKEQAALNKILSRALTANLIAVNRLAVFTPFHMYILICA